MKRLQDYANEYSKDIESQNHFMEGFKAGAKFNRELTIHTYNDVISKILKQTDIFEKDNYWDLTIKSLEERIEDLEGKIREYQDDFGDTY